MLTGISRPVLYVLRFVIGYPSTMTGFRNNLCQHCPVVVVSAIFRMQNPKEPRVMVLPGSGGWWILIVGMQTIIFSSSDSLRAAPSHPICSTTSATLSAHPSIVASRNAFSSLSPTVVLSGNIPVILCQLLLPSALDENHGLGRTFTSPIRIKGTLQDGKKVWSRSR